MGVCAEAQGVTQKRLRVPSAQTHVRRHLALGRNLRNSEQNIGIDPANIQPALRDLCEDVKVQIRHKSYPLDEIAARFSHRLVWIHPFANGNGRLSRTIADVLLVQYDAPPFTWGAGNLVFDGKVRQNYIRALRAADARDYGPLLAFVRS